VLGFDENTDMRKLKGRSASVHRSLKTTSFELRVISLGHLLTYSMEQSPSLEANWFCS